jgi:hypothetical protein
MQTSKGPLVGSLGSIACFAGFICRIIGYEYIANYSGSFPRVMNIIKFIIFILVVGNSRQISRTRRRKKNNK